VISSGLKWKPWEGWLCTRHLPPALPPPRCARRQSLPTPTRIGHLLALPTLLLALSGCVVPVGPEWTDPQSNVPPTIYSANPPIGFNLAPDAGVGGPLLVEVVLADQNTQDRLYARWIIDYPPWSDGISSVALPHTQPGGDQILRPSISYAPTCNDDAISHQASNHRLLLAVSDQPFAYDSPFSQSYLPDEVPTGNFRVEGSWQFVLDCP